MLSEAKTDNPLNWLGLPVVDKLWRSRRANEGGFIQEATGWKKYYTVTSEVCTAVSEHNYAALGGEKLITRQFLEAAWLLCLTALRRHEVKAVPQLTP